MQGEKQLIDDILNSAKRAAQTMVDEATAEQNAVMQRLKAELDGQRLTADAEIAAMAERAYAGKVKLGELEAGKIMLDAKQRCVGAVYDCVYEKLAGLSDAKYLALMKKLIAPIAENGDEIIAGEGDKRITDAWVKKLGTELKVKLVLSKTRGDFACGVILRNGKYDRSLTAEDMVAELKERTVGDTVSRLAL